MYTLIHFSQIDYLVHEDSWHGCSEVVRLCCKWNGRSKKSSPSVCWGWLCSMAFVQGVSLIWHLKGVWFCSFLALERYIVGDITCLINKVWNVVYQAMRTWKYLNVVAICCDNAISWTLCRLVWIHYKSFQDKAIEIIRCNLPLEVLRSEGAKSTQIRNLGP